MVGRGTIIVNPAAGRGKGAAKLKAAIAGSPLAEWEWRETKRPGDAEAMAREIASTGGIVAAAGGDGTISEVAAGLAHSAAGLAVLPIGTGNDFARSLGFGASLPKALAAIDAGTTREVDMIRWACGGRTGLSINIAGCGFDAVVARRINEGFRGLRGTTAYIAAVLTSLGTYRPAEMRLSVDAETIETTVMLCAVANAQSYGGGMRVAPDARMDDGLLDVVVVEGLPPTQFLRAFPRVFAGTHVTHPKVRILRGKSVRIACTPPLPVLSDGELVGETDAIFEIVPRALHVFSGT